MPELPEVETVVRGLRAVLPGRTVTGLRLGKTDFIEDVERLEGALPGARFEEVRRFGKFIGLRLEGRGAANGEKDGRWLMVHLGMTGQFVVCGAGAPDRPHTH